MTAPMYRQETVLAMELAHRHKGRLVQIITESWSLTGTLTKVAQHDNREWDIDYANGRRLVPRSGEIYAVLTIGPWTGRVTGNQPVTVETVAGTLEAPERAARLDVISGNLDVLERSEEAAVEGWPPPPGVHWVRGGHAVCMNMGPKIIGTYIKAEATCPACLRVIHTDPDDPHNEVP